MSILGGDVDAEAAARAELCPMPGCGKPNGHTGFHRGRGNQPGARRKNADDPAGAAGGDGGADNPLRQRAKIIDLNARGKGAREELLDEAERIALGLHASTAAMTAGFAPLTAGYVTTKAEDNTRHVLTIAARHPKVLEAILAMAEWDAYLGLSMFAVGMVIAPLVEIGWLRGDGAMSKAFEVEPVWAEIMAMRAEDDEQIASHYGPPGGFDDPYTPSGLLSELPA